MKARLKIWVIMVLTLAVVVVYATSGVNEIDINGLKLRKLDLSSILNDRQKEANDESEEAMKGFKNGVDTTHQRLMFFGDSMTEGLFYSLDEYCQANGHKLYSATWYSATTESFANSNLLDTYIKKYHPTYFIICLGSNELFVKDLSERKKYIDKILDKIGNRPFVWISPPNWKKDTGMDSVIRKTVGDKHYFNSTRLSLQRNNDHMHPTLEASSEWMDKIAEWISKPSATAHPIIMRHPQIQYRHTFTDYYQTDFNGFSGNDNPERHRRYFK